MTLQAAQTLYRLNMNNEVEAMWKMEVVTPVETGVHKSWAPGYHGY
jgi:hypothetical protein